MTAQTGAEGEEVAAARRELDAAMRRLPQVFKEFHAPIEKRTLLVPKDVDPDRWSTLKKSATRKNLEEAWVDLYPVLRKDGERLRLEVMVSLVGGDRSFNIQALVFNCGGEPATLPIRGSLKDRIATVLDREWREFRAEWVVTGIPDASSVSKELRTHGVPGTIRISGRTHYIDHVLEGSEKEAWDAAVAMLRAEKRLAALTVPVDAPSSPARASGPPLPAPAPQPPPPEPPAAEPPLFDPKDFGVGATAPVPPKESAADQRRGATAVNLDTASRKELETLPKIGPKLAEEIIRHRPYRAVSDLLKVPGIGESTLRAIESRVSVGRE